MMQSERQKYSCGTLRHQEVPPRVWSSGHNRYIKCRCQRLECCRRGPALPARKDLFGAFMGRGDSGIDLDIVGKREIAVVMDAAVLPAHHPLRRAVATRQFARLNYRQRAMDPDERHRERLPEGHTLT